MSSSSTRLDRVDDLRGIAILLVIWHHLGMNVLFFESSNPFAGLPTETWHGVELFFVISGFVVSRALIPKLQQARQLGRKEFLISVRNFYIQRAFRLLPTCWFWLPVALIAAKIAYPHGVFDWRSTLQEIFAIFGYFYNFYLAADLPYGATFNWYWSLSIEEQFYLLFPIFLLLFPTRLRRVSMMLAMIGLVTFILRPMAVSRGAALWPTLRISSTLKFDGILLGSLVYLALTIPRVQSFALLSWMRRERSVSLSLVLAGAFAMIPLALSDSSWTWKFPLINLLAAMAVLTAAVEAESVRSRNVLNAILLWAGRRSYTLYLAHLPVFMATKGVAMILGWQSPVLLLVIALTVLVVSTEACFQWIEKPLIRKGRQVTGRRDALEI